MPEIPVPYRANDPHSTALVRIAAFLSTFLNPEILVDASCPVNLQKDYDDMNHEEKRELFEYTFYTIFKETAFQIARILGRELRLVELNLIKKGF